MAEFDPTEQRAFALEIVRELRAGGCEAYWAGGCVRDQLLGREPKDYDVATAATPEQVQSLFRRRRTLALGAAFGVITVLGPRQAGQIEVATFRRDTSYSDGRHPDAVIFSSAEQDAQRRDFTINGLFFDPIEERVIDFVGGQQDLAAGVIRAIGAARERFAEDKLRLLRAVRFATRLGFALEPATREAVAEMADQIIVVSPERIAAEMRFMLTHANRAAAVEMLRSLGLLAAIMPELVARVAAVEAEPEDAGGAWRRTLDVLANLAAPSFPLALAALCHTYLLPNETTDACRRWRLSNRETARASYLVAQQISLFEARQMPWSGLQRLLIADGIEELLALHAAVARATGAETADLEYCRQKLQMPAEALNPSPLLTGDDLVAHGVPRGKIYQRLLEQVRDSQLEKSIATKAEALALVDRLLG